MTMKQIEVDEEVYSLLERAAKPFVEPIPNATLRRLLGLSGLPAPGITPAVASTFELDQLLAESMAGRRSKAPKASLKLLTREGLIRENERLHLIDYKGNRVPNQEAAVSGAGLLHNGQHYTMSDLAQALLKQQGFTSSSVRGPLHWANAKGETIAELWKRVLANRTKR